jgi:hypothetical protein
MIGLLVNNFMALLLKLLLDLYFFNGMDFY